MNVLMPQTQKGILSGGVPVTGPNVNVEGMNGLAILQTDATEYVEVEGMNGIAILQVTYP